MKYKPFTASQPLSLETAKKFCSDNGFRRAGQHWYHDGQLYLVLANDDQFFTAIFLEGEQHTFLWSQTESTWDFFAPTAEYLLRFAEEFGLDLSLSYLRQGQKWHCFNHRNKQNFCDGNPAEAVVKHLFAIFK